MVVIFSRPQCIKMLPWHSAKHKWIENCKAWWHHQMETFSGYWPFVWGIHWSPVKIPAQRPVTRSFDVSFDLRLNKRLSKQSWGWWFETPTCTLWRHRKGFSAGRGLTWDIGIDTNIEVIVVSLTTWEAHHSQRAKPEGEARGLWWASQVINETTMTEIEVSISILSWWN